MRIKLQIAIALLALYGAAAWLRPSSSDARANARANADPPRTEDAAPEPPVRAAPVQLEIARAKPVPYVGREVQPRPPEALSVSDVAIARMRERWESEHDDPEWSDNERATANALFDLFALPEDLLLDVSCRTTVCRIAVDTHDIGRFVGLAQHLRDEEYPIAVTLGDDTSGQAVAYLPRAGLEQELFDPPATHGLDPARGD